jgi:hypothetical protein
MIETTGSTAHGTKIKLPDLPRCARGEARAVSALLAYGE